MPTVFGATLIPDRSVWGRVEMISVSFVTDGHAAAALLPGTIQVSKDDPVVTVSRMSYSDVDYLAGGGYQEVTVGISAMLETDDGRVRGSYMPVVWVDEHIPIQIGREFLGYAKVPGELADVRRTADTAHFELSERGTVLLEGQATGLAPVPAERLEAMRAAAKETSVLGWKYIPSVDGEPDADYPLQIMLEFDWAEVFAGEGSITFATPAWAEAPVASRIVEALSRLPKRTPGRATVAVGAGAIDRAAARRLRTDGSAVRHAR